MTLLVSLLVFGATLVIGLGLVLLHGLRRRRLAGRIGLFHAALGAAGLALLIWALGTLPPRGLTEGAGGFGEVAAVLLGFAFLAGVSLWRGRRRRGDPTLLIGIHATLAIFGVVILAAYFAAP